jgi:sodium transport system permease protein
MAMGLDTTAGEKERGGLAALLVNQVSRTSIALGKIFFVVTSGLINSTSSFLGLLIAFRLNRAFFGASIFSGTMALTPLSISALLLVLFVGSGVAASIIVLLGSLARNMKEGAGYVTPVYIVVIVLGVATISMDAVSSISVYLIPLVNIVFCLKGIILSQIQLVQLLLTVGVNALLISVIALITSRLYNSERILNTIN